MIVKKETERSIALKTDVINLKITWDEFIKILELFMYEEIGKEKQI